MTEKPYADADVETAARAEYEHDMRVTLCPDTWDETFPFVRDAYRDRARAGLDALAADGRLAPVDDDPRHIIELRADGWTIKHPLSCRLGDLFGCRVNLAAEDLDGPPAPPGRYEASVDGIDGRLRVGDRVEP